MWRIQNFDNSILLYINDKKHGQIMNKIMLGFTYMGNGGTIWIIIAAFLLIDKTNRMAGAAVILTLIISTIIGQGIIKHIVRRRRPCNNRENGDLLIRKPLDYSFPSGHTLSSFAAAQVLSVYFTKYEMIFLIIAFFIALSRIYLQVHYPTDIIAGIVLGLFCSRLIFLILQGSYIERAIKFALK